MPILRTRMAQRNPKRPRPPSAAAQPRRPMAPSRRGSATSQQRPYLTRRRTVAARRRTRQSPTPTTSQARGILARTIRVLMVEPAASRRAAVLPVFVPLAAVSCIQCACSQLRPSWRACTTCPLTGCAQVGRGDKGGGVANGEPLRRQRAWRCHALPRGTRCLPR